MNSPLTWCDAPAAVAVSHAAFDAFDSSTTAVTRGLELQQQAHEYQRLRESNTTKSNGSCSTSCTTSTSYTTTTILLRLFLQHRLNHRLVASMAVWEWEGEVQTRS